MESRVRGNQLQTLLAYDDIEPLCTWEREDGLDVLVIHLPEFKKEQLRIQISNAGLMKISGENVTEDKKRIRFLKEVKVTKDYDTNNIYARFSQGCLRVTLPKKIITPPYMPKPLPPFVTSLSHNGQSDDVSTNEKTNVPDVIKTKSDGVLKSNTFTKVIVTVGFALVVAFTVYTTYKYWTFNYAQVYETILILPTKLVQETFSTRQENKVATTFIEILMFMFLHLRLVSLCCKNKPDQEKSGLLCCFNP
ncbi:hypothetical protein R6Q57_010494 [Mikania cordata]